MLFDKRKKVKFIVTSGPTREFVDPIRYLSNPSTGKMGYHIARAAINQGYQVVYISGPVNSAFRTVPGAKNIEVVSTQNMLEAVQQEVGSNVVLVMAAAPADYRPEKKFEHKLKKKDAPTIHLVPNPDILRTIADQKETEKIENLFLVGFAAETQNVEEYAREKLKKKSLEMIFLNDVTGPKDGFGTDNNLLTVFFKNGTDEKWQRDSKERLGYRIVETIEMRLLEPLG